MKFAHGEMGIKSLAHGSFIRVVESRHVLAHAIYVGDVLHCFVGVGEEGGKD